MRRGRWWPGLLPLLAVASACESAAIPARRNADVYEFRLATQPPQVLRWPSGATVRVYVAGGDAATRAPVLHAALEAGIAEWNRHALFGEYRLARTTDLGDADVVLRWTDDASPVDLSGCPPASTRAVTTFCAAASDLQQGLAVYPRVDQGPSRVKMLVTVLPSQASVPGRVAALVTHELGHVLGIAGHSDDARDLMYGQELTTSQLSRRDLATVRVLYQVQPQIVP